jgi:hypothetical protein
MLSQEYSMFHKDMDMHGGMITHVAGNTNKILKSIVKYIHWDVFFHVSMYLFSLSFKNVCNSWHYQLHALHYLSPGIIWGVQLIWMEGCVQEMKL